MHSLGPDLNSLVRTEIMVSWIVLLAFAAFVIIVLMLLVKRFGALRTFGWGFSLFVVGLLGLLALTAQVQVVDPVVNARSVSVRSNAQVRGLTSSGDNGPVAEAYTEYEANLNAPTRRQTISSLSRAGGDGSTTSAWDENIAPVANIYPSIPDCGKPLAAKLVKQLQKADQSKNEFQKAEANESVKYRIALINKDDKLERSDFLHFVIKFREQFTSSFSGSLVEDMTGEENAPFETSSDAAFQPLQVTVYELESKKGTQQQGQPSLKWNGRSGQLVCQLKRSGRRGKIELVSDFIEKPWAADPDMFMSQNVKQKLIIGFSPRFATSEQEARASALKDANVRLAKSTNTIFQANYDIEKNIVDRFVQKLTMPYGSVWRQAVLVDYGSPKASFQRFYGDTATAVRVARGENSMEHSGVRVGNTTRTSSKNRRATNMFSIRASPEFRIAVLMLMTIVVGWISNWMTQGYYRGPVWTVTGTLFSIGFLFLILIVLFNLA